MNPSGDQGASSECVAAWRAELMGSRETDPGLLHFMCAAAQATVKLAAGYRQERRKAMNYWKGCVTEGHGLLRCSCSLRQRGGLG